MTEQMGEQVNVELKDEEKRLVCFNHVTSAATDVNVVFVALHHIV